MTIYKVQNKYFEDCEKAVKHAIDIINKRIDQSKWQVTYGYNFHSVEQENGDWIVKINTNFNYLKNRPDLYMIIKAIKVD